MQILLYNFAQPEEPGAGGVGVYLNNLAKALVRDHEVILLSSGDRYSPTRREPRLVFREDAYHRAIVVNSPTIAPAAYSFGDPDTYLTSAGLDFVPAELAQRYGEIDVLHFQNIEGLTRSFFYKLRETFPRARLIYSVHNYHPLCCRFSLWFQDRTMCTDYREGESCTKCRVPTFDPSAIKNTRRVGWAEKAHPLAAKLVSPALEFAKATRRSLIERRMRARAGEDTIDVDDTGAPSRPAPAASYADWRNGNIAMYRDIFDQVLAVSERTRNVVADRGMPPEKVAVSYIGTAHKDTYLTSAKIRDAGEGLHLGYIGYMGTDKGFVFLLECLERMPDDLAARLTVTVAAKSTFPERLIRLRKLVDKLKELRYFDGYTHANLGEVLSGVNLGLIPVLWEDNLPQTAIELISRGIPILTSDRGGAQEIAENPKFIFRAGDHEDFIGRVRRIQDRTLGLNEFWAGPMRIFSMDEHVEDLMRYYAPQRTAALA